MIHPILVTADAYGFKRNEATMAVASMNVHIKGSVIIEGERFNHPPAGLTTKQIGSLLWLSCMLRDIMPVLA